MDFDLDSALAQVMEVVDRHELANRTRKSYQDEWAAFESWCVKQGFVAMPAAPSTVQLYLLVLTSPWIDDSGELHLAHRASRTTVPVAAIRWAHLRGGHIPPTADRGVKALGQLLAGARQSPVKKARPLLLDDIDALAADLPDYGRVERAWTLLLLGMFGAFRGTELVSIRIEHVEIGDRGMRIWVPRSKGDQLGQGEWVGIARRADGPCPVEQLERWMAAIDSRHGWLFPSPQHGGEKHIAWCTLDTDIKALTAAVVNNGPRYSTHSLRRGFCTSAVRAQLSLLSIALKARHESCATTLGYIDTIPGEAVEAVAKALGS